MKKISFSLMFITSLSVAYAQQPFRTAGTGDALQTYQDDRTGYVGIGTAMPLSNLSVSGFVTDPNPYAVVEVTNNQSSLVDISGGQSTTLFSVDYINYSFIVNRNSSNGILHGGTTNNLYTDLVVNASGNTGVGLNSPTTRLHVFSSNENNTDLFQVANDRGPAMYVTKDGNTGIGTASPACLFEVNGNANVKNTLTVGAGNSSGGIVRIMNGGAGLDLINSTNYAGWSNQIRYMDQANNVRHLIFDDNSGSSSNSNGNLVIWPGYSSSANNVLEIKGKVKIGNVPAPASLATLGANYSLYVQSGIITEKVKVALVGGLNWSDYVFDKAYDLPKLDEVKSYIAVNHHLPGVPSMEEVECTGIDMAEMDATLLKKIEELTLYVLQLKEENSIIRKQLPNPKKYKCKK